MAYTVATKIAAPPDAVWKVLTDASAYPSWNTTVAPTTFGGFRPELLEFLRELRGNNSREWFTAHRGEYETLLLEPAREFVVAMADWLPKLGSDIHAEPKVHGSILAINRDTRFSADKTPYKTHLDLWFWQGSGPGLNRERPGYFFRLTPESLILGAGMHALSESALERYRRAVLDDERGIALENISRKIGESSFGGRTYKRVPSRERRRPRGRLPTAIRPTTRPSSRMATSSDASLLTW